MSWHTRVLKSLGWTIEGSFPSYKKMVIIAAPHTSVWDFVNGWLALRHFGLKPKFIIKHEFFFFPIGILLRKLGGIPIKRGNIHNNLVEQMVEYFNQNENFYLVITPEGTRKKTKHWKKGFYLIAQKANVPIIVTKLDYGKKILGPIKEISPNLPYNEVLKEIAHCYKDVTGKKANQFELPKYE
ncbi:MAG: 1-acyl-sn-glycerol-3-phosphate acyltransferase [Bacteroidales bacterium]|nr:1-acyl-sn-glycerol-3-phosphate acyltransferase [Bacteroidales bacterium]